jgi:hypothetical protein
MRKKITFTSYTRDSFKRAAKLSPKKISQGGHRMIPYYYRKKYGKIQPFSKVLKKQVKQAGINKL